MPIFSVYPNLGNPFVRSDLHRLVLPTVLEGDSRQKPLLIMWTSTRDIVRQNWVPHFVPAVPKSPFDTEGDQQVPPPEERVGKWVVVTDN